MRAPTRTYPVAAKFHLSSLTHDADIVAAVVPAGEAFGILSRTLDLPPYWAALVTTALGETQVYAAGSEVDGQGVEEVMLVRTNPLSLQYQFDQLTSEDHYMCDAALTLHVQLVAERSELAAFRSNMVRSEASVQVCDVHAEFQAAVRESVERFVKSLPAARLLGELNTSALLTSLHSALEPLLFKSGMNLSGLHSAAIDSKSYRQTQQQRIQLQRRRARQQARLQVQQAVEQAQNERLSHLQELLARLKTLADESPQADFQELLRTFDESQRGALYEALWSSDETDRVTQWFVVVCGSELLYFDPAAPGQPVRRIPLQTRIGSLRSISCCLNSDNSLVLLVGAARGVLIVDADSGEIVRTCPASVAADKRVRGGFNSVALAGDYVFGAHSELGLWRWQVEKPERTLSVLSEVTTSARTVRHVQFVDGRVYVSIDSKAYSIAVGGDPVAVVKYEGSDETLTALLCSEGCLYAGTAAGKVLCWPVDEPRQVQTLYPGSIRSVESIGRLATGGVERLFFTDTSAAVHAQVIGDAFTCRYQADGQTIRRAEFALDWIVGTNETRDRLFCWPTSKSASSPMVIPVSQLTGHSIQDVCLLPGASALS